VSAIERAAIPDPIATAASISIQPRTRTWANRANRSGVREVRALVAMAEYD
jgi:hypothetical protein